MRKVKLCPLPATKVTKATWSLLLINMHEHRKTVVSSSWSGLYLTGQLAGSNCFVLRNLIRLNSLWWSWKDWVFAKYTDTGVDLDSLSQDQRWSYDPNLGELGCLAPCLNFSPEKWTWSNPLQILPWVWGGVLWRWEVDTTLNLKAALPKVNVQIMSGATSCAPPSQT